MYRCEACGVSTKKRRPMLKKTILKAVRHPEGTEGTQIVREVKLCGDCMEKQSGANRLAG